jgi:hypothetical protein
MTQHKEIYLVIFGQSIHSSLYGRYWVFDVDMLYYSMIDNSFFIDMYQM